MTFGIFVLGAMTGVVIAYILLNRKLKAEIKNRKSLAGKYAEKFIPFLKKVKYNPSDMYFLGMPIDYIVFDGLSDGNIGKVVFMEVKSGESQNTVRENLIRDAVKGKKVEYEQVRV